MSTILRNPLLALVITLLTLVSAPANATLATDLQDLNTESVALKDYLAGTSLNSQSICGPLLEANNMARKLLNNITRVDASLAAPLQVDADVLSALDQLFATSTTLGNEALRLSVDINTLSATANAITLKDGITAMLQLSDDIGTMADRIGEMADKILVMSDNIGLMADRILLTQQIQNENIALTTQSVLQTQTNMLRLVSVVETASYNVSLDSLMTQGELLAARMMSVTLSPWTMSTQLYNVAQDVKAFRDQVQAVNDIISLDSATHTAYVTADTLIKLANLPLMLNSLATAVDGYVSAINSLKAVTSDPTLSSSMNSMLQLSADIGVMANRILEMADVILAMSDNIGLQADQIILTQQTMNGEIAVTQASILAAQEMAIGIIAGLDV